ncbi:MAG: hypothetical protein LBJ92_02755 [Holosporales bacterium]|jgi:lipoic acid synthetase|nr:hypothetical protein [Holosporales bacterium]
MMKKPEWLKVKIPTYPAFDDTLSVVRCNTIRTVCEDASCPNINECWKNKTATFLMMGEYCTRNCGFCNIKSGRPLPIDEGEADRIAISIQNLGIKYAVITSVTRDDLPDGGASHFSHVINRIREINPDICIEILTPDFQECMEEAIDTILNRPFSKPPESDLMGGDMERRTAVYSIVHEDSSTVSTKQKTYYGEFEKGSKAVPDVFGHNIEVVKEHHETVKRPPSSYKKSLEFLRLIKERSKELAIPLVTNPTVSELLEGETARRTAEYSSVRQGDEYQKDECKYSSTVSTKQKTDYGVFGKRLIIKTGIMVGVGETKTNILDCIEEVRAVGVDIMTIGQYLPPSPKHHPLHRYVTPAEFEEYERYGQQIGIKIVAGPFVRSSYRAKEIYEELMGIM